MPITLSGVKLSVWIDVMTLLKRGTVVIVQTLARTFLTLCLTALAAAAAAQSLPSNLDPATLDRLQRQLGAGTSGRSGSDQLDQSREAQPSLEQRLGSGNLSPTSPEEYARQQLRARQLTEQLYEPSPIEKEYQERLSDPSLRQFGYDLFSTAIALSGPVTGQLSNSYVLGIGDELVVTLQGATNDSQTVRVNREGFIIIGALPPIRAAGRTLGAVRSEISAATRQTMLGTTAYTSVGAVRAITVFVGGEVNRPGQIQLTSQADVVSALAQADGVRRTGTLRRIRVIRGGQTISVDLYGLLGIGMSGSVRLQDGDRVIVPVIGETIAITGGVARPGIFELRGDVSVGTALDYAGGAVRSRGSKVSISRINADGSENFVRVSGVGQSVIAGDALIVTGGSAGGALNRVVLRGNVLNPGPRPLPSAPTVRDLLGSINDLKQDTYLPMAVLARRSETTGGRSYEPVNLLSALGSGSPVTLKSGDTLWVFSEADIAFLNTAAVRQIILGQPNPLPQCQSLGKLVETVRDTQSTRFSVVTRGSYIIDRGGRAQAASVGGAGLTQGVRSVEETALAVTDVAQTGCPESFEEEPALLPVLIENSVGVSGNVRRPGAYPIAGEVTAEIAAAVAEGTTGSMDDMVLDLTTARAGEVKLERYAVDADRQVFGRVSLRPGDDIRFNGSQPQFESSAVLLTGEFARPGLYTIQKGETLSQLIARAGGVSGLAYPYGAILTRRSVKQVQEEGFKRTARDLNNAILSIAARKDVSADGIAAVSNIVETLSNAESVGRVVVEADPRVLSQHPELDMVLEGGDAIFMPKIPNYVMVLGDVSNPGAVQHRSNQSVKSYVSDAGGAQFSADGSRIYVVYPNGLAQPVRSSLWRKSNIVVPPGSTVIVPKNLDPLFKLDLFTNIATILGSVVSSLATVAILAAQ